MLYVVLNMKKITIYCVPLVDIEILGWHCLQATRATFAC